MRRQDVQGSPGGIYENNDPNPDSPAASGHHTGGSDAQTRPAKRPRVAKIVAKAAMELAEELDAADEAEDAAGPSSGLTAPKPPHRRRRVLVDTHRQQLPDAAAEQPGNEYEQQRLARIRRNELMLQQLGVQEAAAGVAAAAVTEQRLAQPPAPSRARPRVQERRAPVPAAVLPPRKSARQRGARPPTAAEAAAAAAAELAAGASTQPGTSHQDSEHDALLPLTQYLQLQGIDTSRAVHSDGVFKGWVNPAICTRYGVPEAPQAAWGASGGGQAGAKPASTSAPKGRGGARAFSQTQLQTNPNAYFYRHAQGEWTDEEHALFVETAQQHGVGDKWGVFASYLPQRVGYQCSAYYRDVIIPQGLVIDKRFRMTRAGKAVFVG
ncbi:hypothetical protein ACK3TF_002141 [Chlorella vulgaris]